MINKTILFIGIGFYDYENAIQIELRQCGANIIYYVDLPEFIKKWRFFFLDTIFNKLKAKSIQFHHSKILKSVELKKIDYLFVIKGDKLSADFLIRFRRQHPEATLISYHWDSMNRCPGLIEKQKFFDRVFTFDYQDKKANPQFLFRPLFFRPEIRRKPIGSGSILVYDICFIGWLHHARSQQIKKIAAWAERSGLNGFYHLYSGWFTKAVMGLKGEGEFVSDKVINYLDYVRILSSSKVVIDLPHPQQSGLTMRAVEAIGAGIKIITTSQSIKSYRFYNDNNILVIDPNECDIDMEFIKTRCMPYSGEVLEQYSLKGWVTDIFRDRVLEFGSNLSEYEFIRNDPV
jgi:hypothetical protein